MAVDIKFEVEATLSAASKNKKGHQVRDVEEQALCSLPYTDK